MFPVINIFGKEVGTYGLLALIGILVGGYYCCRLAKKKGLDVNDFLTFMLICSIGVLIGSHILFGITNIQLLINLIKHFNEITSFKVFWECMEVIFGGSVFYGGLIGGIITAFIYAKKKKISVNLYSDICALFVPLFHTFGRIGCFLGGCCYGIESSFGIYYDNSRFYDVEPAVRFPIQLVEALCNFILFLVLRYLYKKGICKDKLFYIYLISYSVIRFVDEFFRGDTIRGFVGIFSTSQIISMGLFVISIFLLIKNRRTSKK